MSRWDRADWYTPAPKKPPPERGIKMKKAGTTWWGQRWIEALQGVLRGDAARLARGRTYARAGRTHDLVVEGGKVTANVTGSRSTPYKITIELPQLTEAGWKKAISGMAAKAQFSAELLAGQMPKEIDEVFRATGSSLFPVQRADLVTSCSCPDWGDPCKHVAAVHYVLGEALDRDPFLLFEVRGKSKDQVLAALRAARGVSRDAAPKAGSKKRAPRAEPTEVTAQEIPRVTLGKLKSADYGAAREAFPVLHFSFDAPVTHGAVLRQLGSPPAWDNELTPADVLAPLIRAAAETARQIAMAVPGESQLGDGPSGIGEIESPKARAPAAIPRTTKRKTARRSSRSP